MNTFTKKLLSKIGNPVLLQAHKHMINSNEPTNWYKNYPSLQLIEYHTRAREL